ncbi:hypothetical protein RFI_08834 [Reticulomyxa filosa]|uniref:Glycosyltransferase 61 catalytic domain-containing protein n=1 Tax=Reticulomyxa filosa TaxID=46433 RepID=X6NSJ5_RETFI|nr:hypothetical protein RFI_08834 [Reticulomyxa filosa]|eukprot:ETO28297.1 hypothetical protein RFI_08834 [Reticulomyxa filosa]
MTMLGEFFLRVIRFMHYYFEQVQLFGKDIQLWVIMQDKSPLFTFHHLFLEKYTLHNVQHASDMMESLHCNCFRRLFLCGFSLEPDSVANRTWLRPTYLPRLSSLRLFPQIISQFNEWVDSVDIHLQRRTLEYKWQRLQNLNILAPKGRNGVPPFSDNSIFQMAPILNRWKIIGFYQRKVRRRWTNLESILRECNTKYNPLHIACDTIFLEDYMHSQDVVVQHRILDMIVGIHGAHLQDAVWMRQNGSFVIELMPANATPWASNLEMPTLVGMTFWDTQFNYVGLKLPESSIVLDPKLPMQRQPWFRRDFQVEWTMLNRVIEFLMVHNGGVCNVFQSGQHFRVPPQIQQYGFAFFNAFCPGDKHPYHFTKEKTG